MDYRERYNHDPIASTRAALDGKQAEMWTALPGIIQDFDPKKCTCTVQPAIQGEISKPDGSSNHINLPLLVDCPVQFPSGGGYTLTFPIAKGDECLVVFSSRCLDSWWQSGGVQRAFEDRMHDLSDGVVVPGIRSLNRPITVSMAGPRITKDDGTVYVEIKGNDINAVTPTNFNVQAAQFNVSAPTINMTATSGVNFTTPSISTSGKITATGNVSAAGTTLDTHTHSNSGGTGVSGPPVPGS